MWKKIGAVGPNSNDNKSSRSKDQNAYEPFSQMSKMRVNDSQMFFQQDQYFCPTYLNKMRSGQGKCVSQSRIMTNKQLQHAKSYKQIPTEYRQTNVRKKTFNQSQMQQLKNRLSRQLFEQMNESAQKVYNSKGEFNLKGQENFRGTQSTQMVGSQTSIQGDMRKLKQCKSTPQFNLGQIPSITEEISLDKKIQTQKNLISLKKQHAQIKKVVNKELSQFKKSFNLIENQIKNKISKIIQSNTTKSKQASLIEDKNKSNIKNNKLNFMQIETQTKRFGQNMKRLNQKKSSMLNKYMSLRVK